MKGVTFGSYHSYDDFNLILSQKIIGTPSPKTNVIDIAGGDGVLDLTEYFGDVKYNNRSISFDFSTTVPQAQFMDLFSKVQNALHGQKLRITLDDDPEFYYVGRISVSEWKADKSIGKLTIDCDCEPWKWKQNETTILTSLSGKNIFDCQNPNLFFRAAVGVSSLETGIRITVERPTAYGYALFTISETKYLIGKKITISWEEESSVPNSYIVVLGFANSAVDFKKTIETATNRKLTMLVDETNASKYDKVVFWLYSSRAAAIPVGEYVDYKNLQIEINDGATEYVAFDSNPKTVDVIASNMRKKVIPTISASKGMTIAKGSTSLAIQANADYKVPQMALSEGNNAFSVTGTSGLFMLKYQEGGL